MADPILGLSTSLGFVVPGEIGAFTANPGYSSSDPPHVGSMTAGTHTYNVEARYMYGDPVPYITEGSTVVAWPYWKYANRNYVGFYATYDSQDADKIILWYVDTDTAGAINGQSTLLSQNGLNMSYAAVNFAYCYKDDLVEDRPWDEAPSTDPEGDPTNVNPQGGEYADTQGYWITDALDFSDLGRIENDTSIYLDYSGFITHYVLTPANMAALGSAFFLPNFWQSLNNKFAGLSDPMSLIISAVEMPFAIGETPSFFKMGGVSLFNEAQTQIPCYENTTRYWTFDCGERTIGEVWGSARDYSDVQVSLYLPYCGVKELDPDLIINHTVSIRVNVDSITGDMLYQIATSNAGRSGTYFQQKTIPYRFTGNCGKQVPIGRYDNSNAVLGLAGMLAGAVVGGVGAAAGAVGPAVSVGGGAAAMGAGASVSGAASAATGAMGFLANGFQTHANTSSGVSGSYGVLDVKYPYILVKRCVPKYPNNWRGEIGALRYQELNVNTLSGYTLFSNIILENMGVAVTEEINELKRLLITEGVIL